MKNIIENKEIIRLKSGRDEKDVRMIEDFFLDLESSINLPILNHDLLVYHFIHAFDYYLEEGKSIRQIIKLISVDNLGDFYLENKREHYMLDNAAIIYPLALKYNMMQMFRLSAELKDNVIPSLLQIALDFTIKRFPTFSTVVKTGFFWHYLECENNVPIVEEERDIPCRPISIFLRTYRSFRVLYYKKRVSVEFFHVLTDGSGGMVFLKTLLSEYYRLLGKKADYINGSLDVNEVPDEAELSNEFKNATGENDFGKFIDKPSLQLDGKLKSVNPSKIIHFVIDANKLKEVSKGYGGTVTAYLLALSFRAARRSIRKGKGIFNIQVPVNMRKFNGAKTLRNYSMYFNASKDISELGDKKELVKELGKQIKEKGNEKMMNQMMMTTGKLINSLSNVPMMIKMPIIQSVYSFFSNGIIGCTLSNLGVIEVNKQLEKNIDRFEFILVPGKPNRVSTSAITFNNKTVFTIIKANSESTFEESIYEELISDGINVAVEGSVDYES